MSTRTITTILAALLALALASAASAQIPDTNWGQAADPAYTIAGWTDPLATQVWVAGQLPMSTEADARALVRLTDTADIERNLDMTVLASDVSYDLAALGIGPVAMFAGIGDSGHDLLVLLTSHGADVYLFVFAVDDLDRLDTEAAAMWSVDVMLSGMATAPAGFVALDDGSVPAWNVKGA
jgi:hypothetical protein